MSDGDAWWGVLLQSAGEAVCDDSITFLGTESFSFSPASSHLEYFDFMAGTVAGDIVAVMISDGARIVYHGGTLNDPYFSPYFVEKSVAILFDLGNTTTDQYGEELVSIRELTQDDIDLGQMYFTLDSESGFDTWVTFAYYRQPNGSYQNFSSIGLNEFTDSEFDYSEEFGPRNADNLRRDYFVVGAGHGSATITGLTNLSEEFSASDSQHNAFVGDDLAEFADLANVTVTLDSGENTMLGVIYTQARNICGPLDAPVLSVDCSTPGTNDLSWTNVGAGYYLIETSLYGTGWTPLDSTDHFTTTYSDVTGDFTVYRVTAFLNNLESSPSNIVAAGQLPTPSVVPIGEAGDIDVNIGNTVPCTADVLLERSDDGGSWNLIATITDLIPASVTHYIDTDVVDGVTYCYRVTAEADPSCDCVTDSDTSDGTDCAMLVDCDFTPGNLINDDFADALSLEPPTYPDPFPEYDFGSFDIPHVPTDGETLIGATKESGEPDHNGDPGGNSIWFSFVPDLDGAWYVEADTRSSGDAPTDLLLAVYTGTDVASLTEVTYDIISPTVGSFSDDCGAQSYTYLEATLSAGTTYYVAVDGAGGIEVEAIYLTAFLDA